MKMEKLQEEIFIFLGKEITNSNPSEIVKKGLFQVMEGRRCIADMTVH